MKRRTVNETTKQWMIYLQDVKYQLDNFKIGVITDFAKKYQIDTKLGQFLKQSNVIYKDDFGYYRWNEKIPVSIKIINAYRKEQNKRNVGKKLRRIQNINKPIQQEMKFTENNYNEFVTIEDVKKIYNKSETTIRNLVRVLRKTQNDNIRYSISKRGREIILLKKSYLDNLYHNSNYELEELITKSKMYSPYQEKKVGLIRKFLKWIY